MTESVPAAALSFARHVGNLRQVRSAATSALGLLRRRMFFAASFAYAQMRLPFLALDALEELPALQDEEGEAEAAAEAAAVAAKLAHDDMINSGTFSFAGFGTPPPPPAATSAAATLTVSSGGPAPSEVAAGDTFAGLLRAWRTVLAIRVAVTALGSVRFLARALCLVVAMLPPDTIPRFTF